MEFEKDENSGARTVIQAKDILAHIGELERKANGSIHEGDEDWNRILGEVEKMRIRPDESIRQKQLVLSFGSSPIAELGDFSLAIGKAKAKKTFFIILLVGALLKGVLSQITGYKIHGKTRIIWFDTEQGRNHVIKAFKRALAICGGSDQYEIEVYALRPLPPKERLEKINFVLTELNPKKDIAFAVIDGVRDLVTDINDPDQATEISSWLLKTTEENDLHICTVLHQNKNDANARGHLGTELVNKAQTVISVQKYNESISTVKPEFSRDREFIPFSFQIDDITELPYIQAGDCLEMTQKTGTGRSRNPLPDSISEVIHKQVMADVFNSLNEYSYPELLNQAGKVYNNSGLPYGEAWIKKAVQHCVIDLKIIRKNGNQGSKGKYVLNQDLGSPV